MARLFYATEDPTIFEKLPLDIIDTLNDTSNELITDLPLETGRSVNDNAVSESREITITGVVSNLIEQEGRSENLPSIAWELILKLKRENTFFMLINELESIEPLIIKDVERNENARTSNNLIVRITLKKIEFIDVNFSQITRQAVKTNPENDLVIENNLEPDQEFIPEPLPAENKTSQIDLGTQQTLQLDNYYEFTDPSFNVGQNAVRFRQGGL